MPITKQQKILISTDLTVGLIAVLKNASASGELRGRERKLATAYVDLLEKHMTATQGKKRVGLSVNVIANTLRIILMVIKPDPLVKALVEFIGKAL